MTIYSRHCRLLAAFVGLGLWTVSLVLPALSMEFDPANGQIVLEGHKVLSMGLVALVWGQFGWLANIALLAVLIGLVANPIPARFTRWSAIALIVLALDTLDLMIRFEFHGRPHLLSGYYVWMAGNLLVAAFAIMVTSRSRALAT